MPGQSMKGKKYHKSQNVKDLLAASDYVDAGEIEVVAALRDIPENRNKAFESDERKFGCLPWRLQLHKEVMIYQPTEEEKQEPQDNEILGPAQHNKPITVIRATLVCGTNEEGAWTVQASGVLSMEKWPEKVKSKEEDDDQQGVEEMNGTGLKERFLSKFNPLRCKYRFLKGIPVPNNTSHSHAFVADSAYMKNGQFKLRLELVLHRVQKVHFLDFDFNKKTPMWNATAKITDKQGQVHRFFFNKDYLSLHSESLARMFFNPHFKEGAKSEVEFKEEEGVSREMFQEFLAIIYSSQSHCRYKKVKRIAELLDFARQWFIPSVTAVCEQRLLAIEEKEMCVGDRLILADQYGLLEVKSQIMQRLDENLEDKYIEKLSKETKDMLERKQKRQAEKKHGRGGTKAKQAEKGGDEQMDVDQQPSTSAPRQQAAGRSAQTARRGGGRGGSGRGCGH